MSPSDSFWIFGVVSITDAYAEDFCLEWRSTGSLLFSFKNIEYKYICKLLFQKVVRDIKTKIDEKNSKSGNRKQANKDEDSSRSTKIC